MTSFYNKYNLNNQEDKSILKKEYTLNYNDHTKLNMNEQYNKLYTNINDINNREEIKIENTKIYNLSFTTLFTEATKTYINLLNDLSIYFDKNNNNKNLNQLGYILTKDYNLLYIGLLFIMLSLLIWLINISS